MPPVRTERFPKERHGVFLSKAEEFGWAMESALSADKRSAAVSAAVHCVTSSCDALIAFHLGIRSKGQDHREIVSLVTDLPVPSVSEHARQVLQVLDLKGAAEYEGRAITPEEARLSVQRARRVLEWVRGNLPDATSPRRRAG